MSRRFKISSFLAAWLLMWGVRIVWLAEDPLTGESDMNRVTDADMIDAAFMALFSVPFLWAFILVVAMAVRWTFRKVSGGSS